ncbi:MAG: transcription-repair coupling factor, partial [Chitinophagaceae bacterium]|nr:transcription-repair coupling factor [Chitinophagaceae bacterium]
MNLQSLLGVYQNDIRLKQLAAAISLPSPKIRVALDNLYGSSLNFVATAIWQLTSSKIDTIGNGANHVFVLNDHEEAAYFHNDFEQLSKALDICYFPDSFKKPGDYKELNSSHVMLRTEALTKFSNERKGGVLVCYPESLLERVVNPKMLSGNMISIKVGENLKIDPLLERLSNLQFRREDFVYEPGQFAMRGGILDIYSFGNEHPYRIELFGNEVDSIRIFNPETQLSERKLLQVSILPNVETKFEAEEKISLLEYLPENTVFWFKDLDFALSKLHKLADELPTKITNNSVAVAQDEDWIRPLSLLDFEDIDTWKNELDKRHIIEWRNHSLAKHFVSAEPIHLQFATEEQPVFNRQFEMLIADLKKKNTQQYTAYIFAENPKQLERLHSIFEDLNAGILFVPIPNAISKGFIEHEKKILCYTEHQIFQRYHKYKVKQAYTKGKAISLKALRDLQPGDFVSHIDHGVGKYSGLQKIEVTGNMQEAVRIIYRDNDVLYVNINSLHKISKYTGKEGTIPKVHKLGSDAWEKLKTKTKKQVKDIAADL